MSAEDTSASASTIATRLKAVRDTLPADLALRLHRAASWLKRSEEEVNDPDVRFILLWIAFNAAYAHEIDGDAPISERVERSLPPAAADIGSEPGGPVAKNGQGTKPRGARARLWG